MSVFLKEKNLPLLLNREHNIFDLQKNILLVMCLKKRIKLIRRVKRYSDELTCGVGWGKRRCGICPSHQDAMGSILGVLEIY